MLSGMAGDDARTQTEIARMDNQIAVANKRVELFNAEQALTIRQGGARAPSGIPTLIGITGPKTRLTGKFVYDSRSVVYARIGDAMPSGYTLHAITPNNAVLRKGDEQITLTIAYTRELGQPGPFMPSSAAIPVDSAGPIVGRNIAPPTNR
jgi:type IV pilus biogenesis protein PilP